jgi:hypothetical protein
MVTNIQKQGAHMPFHYVNSSGKSIKISTKINMCERRGMMSFCRAETIDDQKGCKFRMDSSDKHCLHFRETIDHACDSVFAQTGKEPYDCKDCSNYSTCTLKGNENECTIIEKKKRIEDSKKK